VLFRSILLTHVNSQDQTFDSIMVPRMSVVFLLAILTTASSWVSMPTLSRKDFFQKAISFGAAATMAPVTAKAVDFSGSYEDPFHPNCKRIISMNGSSTKLKGTDGSPGCPADGSGKAWSLDGIVKGNEIFVDFTPKGGPKDLKGVWDGSGINWPDGSKWSIKN